MLSSALKASPWHSITSKLNTISIKNQLCRCAVFGPKNAALLYAICSEKLL